MRAPELSKLTKKQLIRRYETGWGEAMPSIVKKMKKEKILKLVKEAEGR